MLLTLVLVCVAALALLIAVPAYVAFATHNRLLGIERVLIDEPLAFKF
jgi:hypothetical protein